MHEQHILLFGVFYCFVDEVLLWRKGLAEAHVYNLCAIINCIANGIGYVLVAFITSWRGPQTHNPHVGCNTVDANAIVSLRGDHAGNRSAVVGARSFHIRVTVDWSWYRRIIPNDGSWIVIYVEEIIEIITVMLLKLGQQCFCEAAFITRNKETLCSKNFGRCLG